MKIKRIYCTNGSKQRRYIDKEYATSPTARTESLLITVAIDANERRTVAVFDILGVYLHTDIYEDVIMIHKVALSELMVNVEPSLYSKYVIVNSKGESLLYVKIHKALY